MNTGLRRRGARALSFLLFASALGATTIPRLTFEQLADTSDFIVAGRITQSWGAWDPDHKYIWTHYRLSVSDTAQGSAVSTIEFAEPGGTVGVATTLVAGSVTYSIGSQVLVFLSRMPNGYLRTAGWAQGKFAIDSAGRLHGATLGAAETVALNSAARGTPLTVLEGLSLRELKGRVAARLRVTGASPQ